ncbi:MAG: PAC2 family protein, partial [Candidatus Thermoplasmatota archaeon]|nr:PAC2 family protein [Candidatus Thermoplasmatota archaeon]
RCDNLVVLVSEAPVPPRMCLPLAEVLLEYSHQKGFQAGVLIDAFSHEQESGHEVMDTDDTDETMLGIGATDWALEQLKDMDIPLLEAGMVAGMSGVLLGEGRRRGLNMLCIMAEAAGGIPDARAAARVIERLNRMLPAIELDTEPLLAEAERIEAQIKAMIAHQLGAQDDDESGEPNAMLYG